MKKFLSSIVFLLIIFSSAAPVYAAGAWAGVDSFDTYANGSLNTLNGGSGWSGAWTGDTHYTVESTVTLNACSTKATSITTLGGSDLIINRSLTTAANSGDEYFAFRGDGNSSDYFATDLYNGTTLGGFVQLRSGGSAPTNKELVVDDNSGVTVLLNPIVSGTWYIIDVNFITATTFKVRWKASGGTFSSFTGTLTWRNSVSTINAIDLDNGNAGSDTFYIDQIQTTDPDTCVVNTGYNDYSGWWNLFQ